LTFVTPDQELTLIFGALHLMAIGLGGVLFWMLLRSEPVTPWQPPEDEESDGGGGGGNDRLGAGPKSPAPGGVPLPDAVPARVRLRAPGRLADAYPPPQRRERPHRDPVRTPEKV